MPGAQTRRLRPPKSLLHIQLHAFQRVPPDLQRAFRIAVRSAARCIPRAAICDRLFVTFRKAVRRVLVSQEPHLDARDVVPPNTVMSPGICAGAFVHRFAVRDLKLVKPIVVRMIQHGDLHVLVDRGLARHIVVSCHIDHIRARTRADLPLRWIVQVQVDAEIVLGDEAALRIAVLHEADVIQEEVPPLRIRRVCHDVDLLQIVLDARPIIGGVLCRVDGQKCTRRGAKSDHECDQNAKDSHENTLCAPLDCQIILVSACKKHRFPRCIQNEYKCT